MLLFSNFRQYFRVIICKIRITCLPLHDVKSDVIYWSACEIWLLNLYYEYIMLTSDPSANRMIFQDNLKPTKM